MASESYFSDGLRRLIVIAIAAVVAASIAVICWASVRVAEADREKRARLGEACTQIEDEILQSECIRSVK